MGLRAHFPEAVRVNPYWKALLEDFSRVNVGLATYKEQVERVEASLSDTTISAESILDALTRMPLWIDNLRKVMITRLCSLIQSASERYLDDRDHMVATMEKLSKEEQVAAIGELKTFVAAWEKAAPLSKQFPKREETLRRCSSVMSEAARKRLSLLFEEALAPFKGDEAEFVDADLRRFISLIGSQEIDKLALTKDEKESGKAVFDGLCLYMAEWSENARDDLDLHQELLATLKQFHRVLEATEDIESVMALKLLDVAVQLAAVSQSTPEEVADSPDLIPKMTHWQSLIERQKEEQESAPADIVKHVSAVVKSVSDVIEKIANVKVQRWEQFKATKEAEGRKMFGDEKTRAEAQQGLWAQKLDQTASWSALVAYAEKTLLLPSYAEKVNSYIKTVQKEL